ncbi:MAG: hypothetical protein K6E27_03470 [Eubacterium sp.]|nr:hypothetical protein [Eubacterium sp.]
MMIVIAVLPVIPIIMGILVGYMLDRKYYDWMYEKCKKWYSHMPFSEFSEVVYNVKARAHRMLFIPPMILGLLVGIAIAWLIMSYVRL